MDNLHLADTQAENRVAENRRRVETLEVLPKVERHHREDNRVAESHRQVEIPEGEIQVAETPEAQRAFRER